MATSAAAIVAAAQRLMAQRGDAFTTQEVAKEAGVALQTLYRHFTSKDELLLAVFESMIAGEAARYEAAAELLSDPIERLRVCVTAALEDQSEPPSPARRFFTAEYWRLSALFPAEMARATQPFVDLGERRLREAVAAGVVQSDDPTQDAWLVAKIVMAIFHYRAFAPQDDLLALHAKERLWAFCLAALQPRDARSQ